MKQFRIIRTYEQVRSPGKRIDDLEERFIIQQKGLVWGWNDYPVWDNLTRDYVSIRYKTYQSAQEELAKILLKYSPEVVETRQVK